MAGLGALLAASLAAATCGPRQTTVRFNYPRQAGKAGTVQDAPLQAAMSGDSTNRVPLGQLNDWMF